MTISIITVCFNSESTIESTIESVINQQCDNLEYVIIDGGSNDNTINIINKYKSNIDVFISEKDSGIYDALNKGISKASGDIIGILHADDVFKNNEVISKVLNSFISDVDIVYGDIEYVSKDKISHKTVHIHKSKTYPLQSRNDSSSEEPLLCE